MAYYLGKALANNFNYIPDEKALPHPFPVFISFLL